MAGEAGNGEESPEIIIVPFQDVGHVFPATELGCQLASRGHRVTLFLPSSSSSSTPDDGSLHPLIKVVNFVPAPHAPPPPPGEPRQRGPRRPRTTSSLEDYLLSGRRPEDYSGGDAAGHSSPILCAVVDVMMSGLVETCGRYGIPVVSFFTSSACSAAMELALARFRRSRAESGTPAQETGSGGPIALPGLPDDMALTQVDLVRQRRARPLPPPPHPAPVEHGHGDLAEGNDNHFHSHPPPSPPMTHHERQDGRPEGQEEPTHHRGGRPQRGVLGQTDSAVALAFNTCADLEQPFLDYISSQAKKPVWGLGPLLPPQFWDAATAASPLVNADAARRRSSTPAPAASEHDVLDWLGTKPPGSVLYVSFGSRVGPSEPEAAELAAALADSHRPFIWAMPLQQQGEAGWADELATRAGSRGMVIRGWAPQLLILSHPSTGAFLSHCGWNSTVEALGCGVPVITWPVGGDQFYNAKLVASRLKVGRPISTRAADPGAEITKDDITAAIEGLMEDDEARKKAESLRLVFARGFPECSANSLDALVEFVVGSRK